jgi:hypothetical protein
MSQIELCLADDPELVHKILVESDFYHNGPLGPKRAIKKTKSQVENGQVYLLKLDGQILASFTLSHIPQFRSYLLKYFSPVSHPCYLSRSVIRPDLIASGQHTLLGLRMFKIAFETAKKLGYDALRLEANPRLVGVIGILKALNMQQVYHCRLSDKSNRAYFERVF